MSPANYVLLNRRFENVGEFGYAYNPASTLRRARPWISRLRQVRTGRLLDFFTYNTVDVPPANPPTSRAGIVNLNTRNGPVLASIIRGAWVHDPGAEAILPPDPTYLVSRNDALAAGQAIVQETTNTVPRLTRADVARLAAVAASALHGFPEPRRTKKSRRSHAPWQIQAKRELGT